LEALAFGLSLEAEGYNIVVAGPPSSGRNTAVQAPVKGAASAKPPAPDWCYLYNFADPYRPKAVSMRTGLGGDLRRGMGHLIEVCRTAVPKTFDDESYHERHRQALEHLGEEREGKLAALRRTADEQGFVVQVTPMGFVSVPLGEDGSPMPPEAFNKLAEEERTAFDDRGRVVQDAIGVTVREMRRLEAEERQVVEALGKNVVQYVVRPVLDDLRERFTEPALLRHFDEVEADLLDNVESLRTSQRPVASNAGPGAAEAAHEEIERFFQRYEVNVFVTHGDAAPTGAPVVDERQPTYYNLFGRLDYQPRFGSMTTNFTMIRAGAVHMANGGYLILQVQDLLNDPRSWMKLKRSMKNREVRVEDSGEMTSMQPMVHLVPEPIPLDVKVVLVGPPMTFSLLEAMDADFSDLFKIRAEFQPDAPLGPATIHSYASFVRLSCEETGLRPFGRGALEEVLRYGSRLAGRQDRLSNRYGLIRDLCAEANQHAADVEAVEVEGDHVRAALQAMARRSGLVPDRLRRMIAEGTLHIETTGAVVGQVNGLAVYQVGSRAFGTPTRITCRTGAGSLGVVAIEREVERSGAIHSKGVLVLSGYLMGTFGRSHPLSFSASVTFEQSYDEVDGDSASSAELYAILTSLARVPMRQDIAVTGSVDQFGNVQPVGGVTEKVEGFFDVCRAIGLSGSQGVVIPKSNEVNLTLRDEVARAVAAGEFHVWSVSRVEEGLELLTGVAAGERAAADASGEDGVFAAGTIFARVEERLAAMREAATPGGAMLPGRGVGEDPTAAG
jgi:predicted ATP-dependent protease